MNNLKTNSPCLFNTLYIQYIEDVGKNEFVHYNLKYPIIHNVKNGYFQVKEDILQNLNDSIKSSVYTFKDKISKENEMYRVFSSYDTTFNKNQAISITLRLMAFGETNEFNELYNYNIDLLTGNDIFLKNIFLPNVDYISLVSDFVNFNISKNPENYYENANVTIPEAQAFYITDEGIMIYFAVDEIAPKETGIPKFYMKFSDFESYINPRFYCKSKTNRNSKKSKYNRMYF